MSSVAEIHWENFKESLNRLGVLSSFLIVFGTTISIYLRETIGIVIGIPDDIEVFGVPLNRKEAFLAVIVIYLVQWVVLKKLLFVKQSIGKPGCELEKCKAFALGRQNIFNPFARFDGKIGALSSLLSLSIFFNGVFLFPLIFTAQALTSGFTNLILLLVFYLPLLIPFLFSIYTIDYVLVRKQYAIFRQILLAIVTASIVIISWSST